MIDWIKDKWQRFKKWIIAAFLITPVLAMSLVGGSVDATEYVTAPENNTFKIGVANFQDEFKPNITDERPLQYKLDDKYISFKPTRMYFDGLTVSSKLTETSIKSQKNEYLGVFGAGIDLEMTTSDRTWQKLIKINSLKDLGTIPPTAQNLIIEFEIETNFVIDGWDRKSDLEITDKIRLGDFSYIEQASVWDSYRETICDDPEDEATCETLTNRQKVKTVLSARDDKEFLSKHLPVTWLKTAQYPSETDVDITYGTEQTFSTNAINSPQVATINENKFVTCFIDDTATDDGICIIGSVSGTVITFGTEVVYNADVEVNNFSTPGVCKIDDDKFAVVYVGDLLVDDGFTRVSAVTGIEIDGFGTEKEFANTDVEYPTCAQLGTDKYITCYNDETNSDQGACVAATVSGTTITTGNNQNIDSGTIFKGDQGNAAQLDANKFVWCFVDGAPGNGKCVAGETTTSTSIIYGSVTEFDADAIQFVGTCDLATDQFVTSYNEQISSDWESTVGTASGLTLTFGTDQTLSTDNVVSGNCTDVDATHFVAIGRDVSDGSDGKSTFNEVDFSARTVTAGDLEEWSPNDSGGSQWSQDTDLISANKIVICWEDDFDSDQGKCIIGDTPAAAAAATYSDAEVRIKGGATMSIKGGSQFRITK